MPTKIEWTDETWNPVTGCSKVSQGCKNCYAMREWPRLAGNPKTVYFGREFTDVRCHPERLDQPLRWTKPRMIFVNSMSDLFHEAVPDDFIDEVFAVMALASQHTFQVLTKRPERMREYLSRPAVEVRIGLQAMAMCLDSVVATKGRSELGRGVSLKATDINPGGLAAWPLPNVCLGVSVEDQASADERIPLLLQTPAAVRWISAEPLLGPVDLPGLFYYGTEKTGGVVPLRDRGHAQLDWVVVGGESGPKARPMHPDWARSLRDQCAAAGVPLLFKQWGEWRPICEGGGDWYSDLYRSRRIAKDGESQEALDDLWGRTCTVPEGVIQIDGALLGHADPGAYQQGTHSMQVFRVGKKRAGRLLDGVQHDGYPVTLYSIKGQI